MADKFKITPARYPDAKSLIDAVARAERHLADDLSETTGVLAKEISDIATNVWKAMSKMNDPATGEVREEMKRVHRHIESVSESLRKIGLEVKDHTGDSFDYGLPLKVITTQPTPGITKESVLETIKPTIYWKDQIIQVGEVIIATPEGTEKKP